MEKLVKCLIIATVHAVVWQHDDLGQCASDGMQSSVMFQKQTIVSQVKKSDIAAGNEQRFVAQVNKSDASAGNEPPPCFKEGVCPPEAVNQCFEEETTRLKRQAQTSAVFSGIGAFADGIGSLAGGKRGKGALFLQTRQKQKQEFIGMIVGAISVGSAIAGAILDGSNAAENAAAPDCVQKGFEAVLDGIKGLQEEVGVISESVQRTEKALENVATSLSENHAEVLSGQTAIQAAFKAGVAKLEHNQVDMMRTARAFRVKVEHAIGILDEKLVESVRNQQTLSLQLDQLALQLAGAEQRLLAEQFSARSIHVIAAAKNIVGAAEDVQDFMGQIHAHRSSLASLQLAGDGAYGTAVQWANTDKRLVTRLQDVVSAAWTRARDSFSTMSVALSEGDFLKKYLKEMIRASAEDYVQSYANRHSGQCSGIISDLQPLLDHVSLDVLNDENVLFEVLTGSIAEIHDLFTTMGSIFGRAAVSSVQYKDSLVTVEHVFGSLQEELSDTDSIIKLVQDLVSPVLSVHCPLSEACRRAVFEADHLASTLKGVQYNADTIAFEPLSQFSGNSDASFYSCSAQPTTIPATFHDGTTTKEKLLIPPIIRHHTMVAYDWDAWRSGDKVVCNSKQNLEHALTCPDHYQLKHGGGRSATWYFSCEATWVWAPFSIHTGFYGFATVEWYLSNSISGSGKVRLVSSHFECRRVETSSSHVASERLTEDASQDLVDANSESWTLGGADWDEVTMSMEQLLAHTIEDSEMRIFSISNEDKCAESLPQGTLIDWSNPESPKLNWNRHDPFFCWDCVMDAHDQWLQVVTVVGHPELNSKLLWNFGDRMTLKQRLHTAVEQSVPVRWEVWRGESHSRTIEGSWRAAANGGIEFGHTSGGCASLFVDGVKHVGLTYTSFMYVVF